MISTILNHIQQHPTEPIALHGMSREGESAYDFLRPRFPQLPFVIIDTNGLDQLKPALREKLTQDPLVSFLPDIESTWSTPPTHLVIKSAGISPYRPDLEAAKKSGVWFTSATQLFFEECPGVIVGVTGTKGKSTTTSMIHHVLSSVLPDTRLGGNIGIPILSTLKDATPETIFVVELSSHQLLDLTLSPHIAVIQPVYPEHLDYYPDAETYMWAKAAITRYQHSTDLVLFNEDSELVTQMVQPSQATKIPFSLHRHVVDGWLQLSETRILPVNEIPLKGEFNQANTIPATIVGLHFGLTADQLAAAIKTFHSLPHRLEPVGTVDGVTYYNDSLATNPGATIKAIQAFPESGKVLIAGGYDRQLEYDELGEEILAQNLKGLVLLPTTGERIWAAIQAAAARQPQTSLPTKLEAQNMPDAVAAAASLATSGDVVLMSPASASFNLFKDYADRGEQFRVAVQSMAGAQP